MILFYAITPQQSGRGGHCPSHLCRRYRPTLKNIASRHGTGNARPYRMYSCIILFVNAYPRHVYLELTNILVHIENKEYASAIHTATVAAVMLAGKTNNAIL
ncbi:MAG: hypothetical protein FWD97_10270 [Defluviitaleaceae bacterium]|nr:hypothetical protein [Defluviitaleaceae bacterium]